MPRKNSVSDDGRSQTPALDVDQPRPRSRSPRRPPLPSPKDKFRSSVKKVIQLHRTSTILSTSSVGAEPGIDPRRHSAYAHYSHIRQNCVIQLVDYSTVRASFGRMTNREFVDLVGNEQAGKREAWVKVRWINVSGISWDVLSTLAVKYDLHPLALEDILHERGHSLSKADYYPKHLFIRILCHYLGSKNENVLSNIIPDEEDSMASWPRTSSPEPMTPAQSRRGSLKDNAGGGATEFEMEEKRPPMGRAEMKRTAAQRRREHAQLTLQELKKDDRVDVVVRPLYIFLLRNGTVLSIQPLSSTSTHDFVTPIMARLRQADTGLRTSADPSLLVQSLIDLVVDSALEVVDAYRETLLSIEHDVLLRPTMKVVRQLHVISGELVLHKRTLEPIRSLIYSLRRYDVDRCMALIDTSKLKPGEKPPRVEGFMSQKARIYLADVHDHMEYILTNLDAFAGAAENLLNFTFNMVSHSMGEIMRRLMIVTIIHLPLTLLAGYFGMNFESMWSTKSDNHTDVWYWIIALPVMAIVLPMFILPDIKRFIHYLQKRTATREVMKSLRRR